MPRSTPPTRDQIAAATDPQLLELHSIWRTTQDLTVIRLIEVELKARGIQIPLGPIGTTG